MSTIHDYPVEVDIAEVDIADYKIYIFRFECVDLNVFPSWRSRKIKAASMLEAFYIFRETQGKVEIISVHRVEF